MELRKKNMQSLLIHFGLILLSSLVVILPELEAYLATFIDPQLVSLIILTVWVIIKKVLDTNE